ncbi:DUF262 domain-containing protein [Streptomyces sp. TG1A-60]|uniref:DUF262 domain-containing protein n=1 Tax=Streptomyces sp. TG1A-60 TaxID=3129111 RepID=UPI0030D5B760
MAGLEDSGSRRRTGGGERPSRFQRYLPLDESDDPELSGLFPSLFAPVEVGDDGRPTGVELEEPADEADSEDGDQDDGPDAISAPFRPESIKIETQATTVDLLLSRMREEMIDLAPDFQRRAGIWSDVDQSRLIESLLLRIPISSFHMAQDADDNWAVVDGIQRLTAIARFMAPGALGMRPLTLRGLDYLHQYHGCGYEELSGRLKIRLRETQLVVHIIQQGTPETVKFNVFSRINTGGMPLKPQEIRHAMIKGPARTYLADLAEDPAFITATGESVSNERMADREMVLRFMAFRLTDPSEHRERDFDQFLVDSMHRVNRLSLGRRYDLAVEFKKAMWCATELFGDHAFRKWRGGKGKSPINKALFEAVAVNLAILDDHRREALVTSRDRVLEGFFELMKDWDFDRAISVATGDPKKVRTRFGMLNELFSGVASGD